MLFWRAQNRKKVIRHKSPSPQGGERGKRRRTREKPPPSPPHPFLTRKKVLGKKKIEKSQSSLSMLGFQRKETFFLFPHSEEFRDQQQKSTFSELNFLVVGGGKKPYRHLSLVQSVSLNQSIPPAMSKKTIYTPERIYRLFPQKIAP